MDGEVETLQPVTKYSMYCTWMVKLIQTLQPVTKYRLDAEAKGSTVFRIPEDVYKTRGR